LPTLIKEQSRHIIPNECGVQTATHEARDILHHIFLDDGLNDLSNSDVIVM
jgi:hypothetical protein